MSWNYRIINRNFHGEDCFGIHEVYYDEDGNIEMWTENPVGIIGDDFNDLWNDYTMKKEAFSKPVLIWEEGSDKLKEKDS